VVVLVVVVASLAVASEVVEGGEKRMRKYHETSVR